MHHVYRDTLKFTYMRAYIIECIVIVMSHCSDPLSETGFCQNYLDLSPVNFPLRMTGLVHVGWCLDSCLRACPAGFAHDFFISLQRLLCSAFLCLSLQQPAAHYCVCYWYQLLLLAFLKCCVCSCAWVGFSLHGTSRIIHPEANSPSGLIWENKWEEVSVFDKVPCQSFRGH